MEATLPVRCFAGITVSPLRLGQFLDAATAAMETRAPLRVTFLNPDYARRALLSRPLREDINDHDVVLVDGNGVRALAPLFGFTVPERLDTDTVAPALLEVLAARGARLFLFGCAPGVADEAARRLVGRFPGLVIAGTEHGFHDVERGHPGRFDAADSEAIAARVEAASTDLLLVSLPTPLQQRWVTEYSHRLSAPLVMTGGSYLDHVAAGNGLDGRFYPAWADALRLNWLYRLLREPRRLWRRYTVEIVEYVGLVLRARLRSLPRPRLGRD